MDKLKIVFFFSGQSRTHLTPRNPSVSPVAKATLSSIGIKHESIFKISHRLSKIDGLYMSS